jgi:hypothetical protein
MRVLVVTSASIRLSYDFVVITKASVRLTRIGFNLPDQTALEMTERTDWGNY